MRFLKAATRPRSPDILALVLLAWLAGCSRPDPVHRETFLSMGTLVEVTLHGVSAEKGREAVAALEEDFQYMHRTWHPWKPGTLGRINLLLPTLKPFSVAPSVLPLIERARALSRASEGLFNPAIGKLVALWGFHRDDPSQGEPPDPAAIQALVDQHPSMDDLVLEGIALRSTNPAVQLDFGAFAKGYAVDIAIERLRGLGVRNALVSAGGDLRVIGRHGDRPWRVGIRNPRGPGVLASVELNDGEAVFTSGDYERYFEKKGIRAHHIIDPRTGYPARGTASVTVIHSDGATADAATTALFVAGPGDWHRIAAKMGVRYVMLVAEDGTVHMNPAMRARARFQVEPPPRVLVSEPLSPEDTSKGSR